MKTSKAIKKPIPVEFVKLDSSVASITNVYEFIYGCTPFNLPVNNVTHEKWLDYCGIVQRQGYLEMKTLESGEGTQNANIGDFILKGIDGECWPVKPHIFNKTYDILE